MTDFKKLAEPFPAEDIEWRAQRTGVASNGNPWVMCLAYVTNRAIQQRLDDVLGPEKWRNEYKQAPEGGTLCGISIKCKDEWITKWDGAENTQVEAVKGGLSGAMKRAAVQWGIGRYLYKLEATFGTVQPNGRHNGSATSKQGGQKVWFKWDAPALPPWALPGKPLKTESPTPTVPTAKTPKQIIAEAKKAMSLATQKQDMTQLKRAFQDAWRALANDYKSRQVVQQHYEQCKAKIAQPIEENRDLAACADTWIKTMESAPDTGALHQFHDEAIQRIDEIYMQIGDNENPAQAQQYNALKGNINSAYEENRVRLMQGAGA